MHLTKVLAPANLLAVMALITCSVVSAAEPNSLSEAERRGGWKLLFDGKTTSGWRNFKSENVSKNWKIEDGALVRYDGAGDLMTRGKYKYFELNLEYRISKGGNSGIMFHVTEKGESTGHSGPEVQVLDNVAGKDPQKAGWLYQLYKPQQPKWAKRVEAEAGIHSPPIDDATRKAGEWNQVYLRVSKQQCEVAVNGVSYYYFKLGDDEWKKRVAKSKFADWPHFAKTNVGHISLQDHGNKVSYRNIKIRVLGDDGRVQNPIDRKLNLKPVVAFPKLKWEGWSGVDDRGRVLEFRPIDITHANDGSNRVFVGTQRGVIHVFKKGDSKSTVFADLSKRIADYKKSNEEGLLGLAFHPEYKKNGEFFVSYSSAAKTRTSVISRFKVSSENPNKADVYSEEILMEIPQPFSNHNGGAILFGNDGYLYIALGDGGSRNDPLANGQNVKSWMGSVLRIDIDRKTGKLPYAIPVDNPFVSVQRAQPEVYAIGFRNIWRMSKDSKTGSIWVADVGQDLWEEVNILEKGGNYGWGSREGTKPFGNRPPRTGKLVDPVWEYDHQVGKSVTGGFVYRGKRLPELQGYYLYADFVSGRIWGLKYDEASKRVVENVGLVDSGMPVLSFGEDADGEVYFTTATQRGNGIYRFERK